MNISIDMGNNIFFALLLENFKVPMIIQISRMISSVNHEPTVKANLVLLVGDRVKMEVRDA